MPSCWQKFHGQAGSSQVNSLGTVLQCHTHKYHHVRVASEGHSITPVPWPRRMADHNNVEGMLPVSLRTWSTHLLFGRPGPRFQSRPGRRPSDRSTWARRAWWAGTSSLSLAISPKIVMRLLAICSPTDARLVCNETVA